MLALLGLTLCQAETALAGKIGVDPVRIELSKAKPNTLVNLRNESDEAVRVQVTVFGWTETADGKMEITPTRDIAFFPSLISLKPREIKRVRLGAPASLFGEVERTYRLFAEELPSAPRKEDPIGLRVLMKIGIPVFLVPNKPFVSVVLNKAEAIGSRLRIDIVNAGNTRQVLSTVVAKILDEEGSEVFAHEFKGWYLLAGGNRVFEVDIPEAACPRARSVTVVAKAEQREYEFSAPLTSLDCSRKH